MKKRNLWLALSIFFTCFIFCRSLKPAAESTNESFIFVQLLSSILENFIHTTPEALYEISTVIVRKTAHVVEYAVQSFLVSGYFSTFEGKIKSNISWIMFAGLLTACVDEAIQLTAEGRAGLLSDVFIDFCGTLIGVIMFISFMRLLSLKKKA